MLKLTDIHKSYKTFDFTQKALDGISLSFRDNEFAAILGPSGSGKTTLLNIVGGLDHYDSGNLEIDEISTKKYKDADWDTYRNNRIGFVFQSYNLISHQSVLANVELALTLSGVSRTERKKRAYKALEEVGLKEHARKLPSQLSGGQMQRVALARALINDPEILLADEPTGALDTKTSEQVMDLLKNIAKDRLVIMVTHNPELADTYANRIIQLQDGKLVSDTNPFDPTKEEQRLGRSIRKVSMSFFTAIALSLSNLMTKKGRTFTTSLAGSIGIIGIAAILALANGINGYIAGIEEETMSIYPLTVQNSGLDLSSILSSTGFSTDTGEADSDGKAGTIRERRIVETLFESQNENDLKSLKEYIIENEDKIDPYVKNIQYTYDLEPQIYLADTSKKIEQVHPDALLKSYGFGGNTGMASLLGGAGGGMNIFSEMPGDISMFEYQYDVRAGHWPTKYDEAVLVLMPDGSISDFALYSMGIRDRAELRKMLEAVMNEKDDDKGKEVKTADIDITYERLLDAKLKIISAADRYVYDDKFNVWIDKSEHKNFMQKLIKKGTDLKIVGIVQAKPDVTITSLNPGINYTPELISHLMDEAATKPIIKKQLAKPRVNVLTGKTFAEENKENRNTNFDFKDLISVDEKAIQNAFTFDQSQLNLDLSGLGGSFDMSSLGDNLSIDTSKLGDSLSMDTSSLKNMEMPKFNMDDLTKAISNEINISPDAFTPILQNVIAGFLTEVAGKGAMQPQEFIDEFSKYIAKPEVQASISTQVGTMLDQSKMSDKIEKTVQTYITGILQKFITQLTKQMTQMQKDIQSQMEKAMGDVQKQIQTQLQTAMGDLPSQIQSEMESAMADLPTQMQNAININQGALASAFKVNMDEREIMELMNTMMNQTEKTAESNLTLLGYANPDSPAGISFFPINFDGKQQVVDFLDEYNRKMEEAGYDNKVITYNDLVGAMMSSVTDIVDTISYALIAFVAISLVVSSIMIGVITYISVLERKKEIGILRALGASKGDVRLVFNAETLIIGFVAGVLGIAITQVISIAANIIVYNQLGIENIAQLPINNAFILIGISMLLAIISGLFPSSSAARKDPVEALRSE